METFYNQFAKIIMFFAQVVLHLFFASIILSGMDIQLLPETNERRPIYLGEAGPASDLLGMCVTGKYQILWSNVWYSELSESVHLNPEYNLTLSENLLEGPVVVSYSSFSTGFISFSYNFSKRGDKKITMFVRFLDLPTRIPHEVCEKLNQTSINESSGLKYWNSYSADKLINRCVIRSAPNSQGLSPQMYLWNAIYITKIKNNNIFTSKHKDEPTTSFYPSQWYDDKWILVPNSYCK